MREVAGRGAFPLPFRAPARPLRGTWTFSSKRDGEPALALPCDRNGRSRAGRCYTWLVDWKAGMTRLANSSMERSAVAESRPGSNGPQ